MAIGLLGKKLGMTHVYDDYGRHVAVTAVQAGPCTVLRLREPQRDGYEAVQVGFESIKEHKVNRPQKGQFKQAGSGPFRYVHEFRVSLTQLAPSGPAAEEPDQREKQEPQGSKPEAKAADAHGWTVGQQVTVKVFQRYEMVDVRGTSIGKGFQGGIKRWGWSGGPESHGSMSHRTPGSIGASASPSRVVKGHHLPGHMGAAHVTVQNLRIMGLYPEANLLLIEGAIPGPKRGLVIVEKSRKRFETVKAPPAIVEVVEEAEGNGKAGKGKSKAKK